MWNWVDLEKVESTNDEVKKLGSGNVVTAIRQTKGRGRLGRNWESLDGNLFMSFCLEFELHNLGQIVFVVGLSLLETIKHYKDIDVKLKWPNDVLINDKKVSGILLETDNKNLIIGIGVNIVIHPDIEGLLYPSTDLLESGIKTDRIKFLHKYMDIFDKNYISWQKKGFTPIKEKWLNNAKGLGTKIKVGGSQGLFKGVDDNGLLLLDTGNDVEKILAGDVFYV